MALKGGAYYELPGGMHIKAGTLSTSNIYVDGNCGNSNSSKVNKEGPDDDFFDSVWNKL